MDRAQCTEVTVQEQAQQKSEITLKGDLTMVSNDLEKDMDIQMQLMGDLFPKGDVQLLNHEMDLDIFSWIYKKLLLRPSMISLDGKNYLGKKCYYKYYLLDI